MSGESREWMAFAIENLATARLTLGEGYYNTCLQNAQQAVEISVGQRSSGFCRRRLDLPAVSRCGRKRSRRRTIDFG